MKIMHFNVKVYRVYFIQHSQKNYGLASAVSDSETLS